MNNLMISTRLTVVNPVLDDCMHNRGPNSHARLFGLDRLAPNGTNAYGYTNFTVSYELCLPARLDHRMARWNSCLNWSVLQLRSALNGKEVPGNYHAAPPTCLDT